MTTILAPVSLGINVAAQIWGLVSSPDMQTISDRHPCAFTPWTPMIGLIFATQTIASVYWLYRVFTSKGPDEGNPARRSYGPTFIVANVCLATWVLLWHYEYFASSESVLVINVLSQLLFLFQSRTAVVPLDTMVLSRLFLGVGILDVLHNGGIAFDVVTTGTVVKVLMGVGFLGAAGVADPVLGGVLGYDLIALAVGQEGSWRTVLGVYAGLVGLVVAGKAFRARRVQAVEI